MIGLFFLGHSLRPIDIYILVERNEVQQVGFGLATKEPFATLLRAVAHTQEDNERTVEQGLAQKVQRP